MVEAQGMWWNTHSAQGSEKQHNVDLVLRLNNDALALAFAEYVALAFNQRCSLHK